MGKDDLQNNIKNVLQKPKKQFTIKPQFYVEITKKIIQHLNGKKGNHDAQSLAKYKIGSDLRPHYTPDQPALHNAKHLTIPTSQRTAMANQKRKTCPRHYKKQTG
jgi:hypothetical protein